MGALSPDLIDQVRIIVTNLSRLIRGSHPFFRGDGRSGFVAFKKGIIFTRFNELIEVRGDESSPLILHRKRAVIINFRDSHFRDDTEIISYLHEEKRRLATMGINLELR